MEPEPGLPPLEPAAASRLDPLLHRRFVEPLLQELIQRADQARRGEVRRPLLGLQGPVGAGKSTLGRQLEQQASTLGLRLLVVSIDDLYLGWPERGERLAGNPFGVSRVPPGSHDIPLLLEALARWRAGGELVVPRFDKRLAAGQGDRSGWRHEACDAVVLEGWLLGCRPLGRKRLGRLMAAAGDPPAAAGSAAIAAPLAGGAPRLRAAERAWLPRWDRELEAYLPLWEACDGLWVLRPVHWGLPRRWRFQAEARQRRGGGGWLPAEQLDGLVRASLCSLPPQLYLDPLLPAGGWTMHRASRATIQRRSATEQPPIAERLTQKSSPSRAETANPGPRLRTAKTGSAEPDPAAARSEATDPEGAGCRWCREGSADVPACSGADPLGSASSEAGGIALSPRDQPWLDIGWLGLTLEMAGSPAGRWSDCPAIPIRAVAILDGCRRCVAVLTRSSAPAQSSEPDSSSSETG